MIYKYRPYKYIFYITASCVNICQTYAHRFDSDDWKATYTVQEAWNSAVSSASHPNLTLTRAAGGVYDFQNFEQE